MGRETGQQEGGKKGLLESKIMKMARTGWPCIMMSSLISLYSSFSSQSISDILHLLREEAVDYTEG